MPEKRDNTGWYLLGAGALLLLAVGKGFGNMMPPHYSNLTPENQQKGNYDWTPQTFIKAFYPLMAQQQQEYGIPVAFNFAQMFAESSEDGHPAASGIAKNALNLYAIQADAGWKGLTYTPPGDPNNAPFRKYLSFKDSIIDHSQYLKNHVNYKPLFASGQDSATWAKLIGSTGYAENPNYSNLIAQVLKVVQPIVDRVAMQHAADPFIPKMFQ